MIGLGRTGWLLIDICMLLEGRGVWGSDGGSELTDCLSIDSDIHILLDERGVWGGDGGSETKAE